MKIIPFNNIVVAKIIENEDIKKSSILVANDGMSGRFIKLEVIEVSKEVPWINKGDIVWANNLFEILNKKEKIGFINSKDILGRIDD